MSKKRRKYTEEFKLDIVKEHLSGKTLTELSKKYTIPASTIGTWLNVLNDKAKEELEEDVVEPEVNVDSDLLQEVERLQLENIKLSKQLEEALAEIKKLNTKTPKADTSVEELNTVINELEEENTQLENLVKERQETVARIRESYRQDLATVKKAFTIWVRDNEELFGEDQ